MSAIDDIAATPPDLAEWQASIEGLLMGPRTPYLWRSREGFADMPGIRSQDEPRPWAHGSWTAPDWADSRAFTFGFKVRAPTADAYDAALDAMERTLVPGAVLTMWVRLPRKGLVRWVVKPRRLAVPTDVAYDVRLLSDAAVQLFAADPIGYGPGAAQTTGFREQAGGLRFPLFSNGASDVGRLDFGQQGSAGELTLTNPGNAETWTVLRIDGPTPPEGFDILDVPSGRRLRYTQAIMAGSSVEIDSATATVILDGVADRSRFLTIREWTAVQPGGATTLAFLPLGAWSVGKLTVAYAPAWW